MRIDSGLQGYYYDQGRFKRPDVDSDEPAAAAAAQPARTQNSASPVVESSTVLSNSLSSALWALETNRDLRQRGLLPNAQGVGMDDEETAGKVNAFYLQYAGEDDIAAA